MSEDALGFAQVLGRIASLAEQICNHPDPEVASAAGELLDWVDAFHRAGLGRLVELIRAGGGERLLASAAEDLVAGTLLSAYELGDSPEVLAGARQGVAAALEPLQPTVESHGGHLEIQSVTDGVASIRVTGTCEDCPSLHVALVPGIQAALEASWPSFRRLELAETSFTPDPAKDSLRCVELSHPFAQALRQPVAAHPEALLQIRGHELS